MSTNPAQPVRRSLLRRLGRGLRGLILWSYERGSWQYDVMVALILVFVLLTPGRWFHDQPLPLAAPEVDVVVLSKTPTVTHYRIRASLLWVYGSDVEAAARALLEERESKPFTITRIVPVEDDAGAVLWYDVWVRK